MVNLRFPDGQDALPARWDLRKSEFDRAEVLWYTANVSVGAHFRICLSALILIFVLSLLAIAGFSLCRLLTILEMSILPYGM